MNKLLTFVFSTIFILFCAAISYNYLNSSTNISKATNRDESSAVNNLKNHKAGFTVPFIENRGQVDNQVRFYAPIKGGTVFVTDSRQIIYSFNQRPNKQSIDTSINTFTFAEEIAGTDIKIISGESLAVTRVNIFHGNEKKKWKSDLSSYEVVNLGEVYDGIELKLKAKGNTVEKYFYVNDGADPEQIRVKLNVEEKPYIDNNGFLNIENSLGNIWFSKPVAYQKVGNKKKYVKVAYVVDGDQYGFKVGNYDKSKELIIDPIIGATYVGGNLGDTAYSVVQDSNGNVYVGGSTSSTAFPGINSGSADNTNVDGSEGFILKLDENLENILEATYYGGDQFDLIMSLTLDSNDNIYAAGTTRSGNLPGIDIDSSADPLFEGTDESFVVRFNSDLDAILSATFIGGENTDRASTIIIDPSGNIYVAGQTIDDLNNTFPGISVNSADSVSQNYEGFIVKLNSDLSSILAATFIGGENVEGTLDTSIQSFELALDSGGNIFLVGRTFSSSFPGVNSESADNTIGFLEAFIVKFNTDLSAILAATYLGGGDSDGGNAIAINASDDVVVGGFTNSSDFPGITSGSVDNILSGTDGFIVRLDNNLSNILSSTYLGGINDNEVVEALVTDANNIIYATGRANDGLIGVDFSSLDIIVQNGEGFVSILNSFLNAASSTYLGGPEMDIGFDILLKGFVEPDLDIFVVGETNSSFFPGIQSSSADSSFEGISDGFAVRLNSIDNIPTFNLKSAAVALRDCIVCPPEVIRVLDTLIFIAIDQVSIGNKIGAATTMQNFINETETFIRSGALPREIGEQLIELANLIITDLTGDLEVACSTLGNNRFNFLPDIDIFKFKGMEDEVITITLDFDPEGGSEGENSILILRKRGNGAIFEIDRGGIPNIITAILNGDGRHRITIVEQLFHPNGFNGDYCLSIESEGFEPPELKPTRFVE